MGGCLHNASGALLQTKKRKTKQHHVYQYSKWIFPFFFYVKNACLSTSVVFFLYMEASCAFASDFSHFMWLKPMLANMV
jgi:hypothetical protein